MDGNTCCAYFTTALYVLNTVYHKFVFLMMVFSRIDSSGIAIVRKWTDYLKENNESEELLLELVQKRATWFDDQFVLYLFKGRTNELEVIDCLSLESIIYF